MSGVRFPAVQSVVLAHNWIRLIYAHTTVFSSAAGLAVAEGCAFLEWIDMSGSKVTDATIDKLVHCCSHLHHIGTSGHLDLLLALTFTLRGSSHTLARRLAQPRM